MDLGFADRSGLEHPPAPLLLLEELCAAAAPGALANVRPIVFELVPAGGTWVFDPCSGMSPLGRQASSVRCDTALWVRCSAALLTRLFADQAFSLCADDDLEVRGDIDELLLLADALAGGSAPMGLQ